MQKASKPPLCAAKSISAGKKAQWAFADSVEWFTRIGGPGRWSARSMEPALVCCPLQAGAKQYWRNEDERHWAIGVLLAILRRRVDGRRQDDLRFHAEFHRRAADAVGSV